MTGPTVKDFIEYVSAAPKHQPIDNRRWDVCALGEYLGARDIPIRVGWRKPHDLVDPSNKAIAERFISELCANDINVTYKHTKGASDVITMYELLNDGRCETYGVLAQALRTGAVVY